MTLDSRGRPKKNWMEGIRKAMNERNLNEGQWEDGKQWSLGVGQRRKTFWNRYTYIHTLDSRERHGTLTQTNCVTLLEQTFCNFRKIWHFCTQIEWLFKIPCYTLWRTKGLKDNLQHSEAWKWSSNGRVTRVLYLDMIRAIEQ